MKSSKFMGTDHLLVDPKRRVSMPARMRKGEDSFVLIVRQGAIAVYPPAAWLALPERAEQYGKSLEVNLDIQGRLLLPRFMMAETGITRKVVVVGAGNHAIIKAEKKK